MSIFYFFRAKGSLSCSWNTEAPARNFGTTTINTFHRVRLLLRSYVTRLVKSVSVCSFVNIMFPAVGLSVAYYFPPNTWFSSLMFWYPSRRLISACSTMFGKLTDFFQTIAPMTDISAQACSKYQVFDPGEFLNTILISSFHSVLLLC